MKKTVNLLKITKKILDGFLLYISLSMLTLMVIVIIIQVFSRQFFNYTPSWSEELSRMLFVWIAFFGIAYGIKEKLHIGVTFFVNMLPDRIQDVFDYFAKVLVIGFGFLLIYYGWEFTILMSNSTLPGLNVPSSVLYAILPISGFYVLLNGVNLLFEKGMHQKYNDEDGGI